MISDFRLLPFCYHSIRHQAASGESLFFHFVEKNSQIVRRDAREFRPRLFLRICRLGVSIHPGRANDLPRCTASSAVLASLPAGHLRVGTIPGRPWAFSHSMKRALASSTFSPSSRTRSFGVRQALIDPSSARARNDQPTFHFDSAPFHPTATTAARPAQTSPRKSGRCSPGPGSHRVRPLAKRVPVQSMEPVTRRVPSELNDRPETSSL